MGTAIDHPMPDWVKPSLVTFDIRLSPQQFTCFCAYCWVL